MSEWTAETRRPTLTQMERFAHATRAPCGQLFFPEPPDDPLPVPDLRTIKDAGIRRPAADLLNALHLCQERQGWYREFAAENELDPVPYIGAVTTQDNPSQLAERMHEALHAPSSPKGRPGSWSETFRRLVDQVESTGALVLVSGIVGANTHRVLRPEECRGFALLDEIAPLIFVNAADTKAAQIFTLVHEFAHLWLGGSALSDTSVGEHQLPGRVSAARHDEAQYVRRARRPARGTLMYLVDANVLMEAKHRYYAFDIAPGFWTWLDLAHGQGAACSIDSVCEELLRGDVGEAQTECKRANADPGRVRRRGGADGRHLRHDARIGCDAPPRGRSTGRRPRRLLRSSLGGIDRRRC